MSSASLFKDRKEAGQKLAKILEDLSAETLSNNDSSAIVLALPRGGVVVGAEISKALKLPLDIVVTRKIDGGGKAEAVSLSQGERFS